MLPYTISFIITTLIFVLYRTKKKSAFRFDRTLLIFSMIPLITLGTFRDVSIGTDTAVYLRGFYKHDNFDHLIENISLFSEFGFVFMSTGINILFSDHRYYFFALISIILFLYLKSILRISKYPLYSLLCFLLLGSFTFHFNGARQGTTLAISALSLIFIFEKKPLKFYLTISIGFLFHKSILLCMLFYYIFNIGFTKKTVFWIITCCTVFGIFVSNLVEIASQFDGRYSGYASDEYEGGGLVTVLFNICIFLWLFTAKKINKIKNKIYDVTLVAMLCCSALGTVSIILNLNPSGILRLTLYFSQLMIFGLPISIMSFRNEFSRYFLILLSLILMVIYFYLTTLSFAKLYPFTYDLPSIY